MPLALDPAVCPQQPAWAPQRTALASEPLPPDARTPSQSSLVWVQSYHPRGTATRPVRGLLAGMPDRAGREPMWACRVPEWVVRKYIPRPHCCCPDGCRLLSSGGLLEALYQQSAGKDDVVTVALLSLLSPRVCRTHFLRTLTSSYTPRSRVVLYSRSKLLRPARGVRLALSRQRLLVSSFPRCASGCVRAECPRVHVT